MRVTIDRSGRLVIPRALRERIGLAHGGEVEIALDGAAVRIEPVPGVELAEQEGLLVIPSTGRSVTRADVEEIVDADRQRH